MFDKIYFSNHFILPYFRQIFSAIYMDILITFCIAHTNLSKDQGIAQISKDVWDDILSDLCHPHIPCRQKESLFIAYKNLNKVRVYED